MADLVKSVELVQYSLTTASGAVTLTKGQDIAYCVPFTTAHGGSDYPDSNFIDTWFSASGTITFQRANTRSTTMTVKCYVVEFEPSEVHVQQEYFEILNGATAGENTFYPSESFRENTTGLVFGYRSSSGNQQLCDHTIRGRVVPETTLADAVSFYKASTVGDIKGHYFLFDATNSGISVQHVYNSFTGTEQVLEIPCVDWYKSFVLGSYACSDASPGYLGRQTCNIFHYNMGTVKCLRNTGTGTIYWAAQVLKFNDNKLHIFDKNTYTFTTGNGSSYTKDLSVEGFPSYDSNLRWDVDKTSIISTTPQCFSRASDDSSPGTIDHLFTSIILPNNYSFTYNRISNVYNTYFTTSIVDWVGISITTGINPSPYDPTVTFVKSVENGRMLVNNNENIVRLTKGQNINNCVIFAKHRLYGGSSDYQREHMACVYLSSLNFLCAKRVGAPYSMCVDYSIVEFYPDQVKVQSGIVSVFDDGTTLTKNVDIQAVDTSKAFLTFSWNSTSMTQNWSRHMYRGRFVDADTIDFYKPFSGNNNDISWFVVEDLGNNFRCTHVEGSTTGNAYAYKTDQDYDIRKVFILSSCAVGTDATYSAYCLYRAYHEWDFTPMYFNNYSGSYIKYYYMTLVNIIRDSTKVYVMQSAPTLGTSTSTYNETYPSIFSEATELTVVSTSMNSCCPSTDTGSGGISGAFVTARITNYDTRNLEISSIDSGGSTRYPFFNIINWEGVSLARTYSLSTSTKSLVRSLEKIILNDQYTRLHYISPTKKQDINQCLPLMSWTGNSSDGNVYKLFPFIRTMPDVDCFEIRALYAPDGNMVVNINLLEFNQDQVKMQHGLVMMNGISLTVTILPVVLSKTFLRFYISPETSNNWDGIHVAHKWLSNTQIEFSCITDRGRIAISYYVVECLQDQWMVQHFWQDFNFGATDYYLSPSITTDVNRSICFISNSSTTTANYTAYGGYRVAFGADMVINLNRNTNSGNLRITSAEIIEFNSKLGVRTFESWIDLSSTQTSNTRSLLLTGRELDLNRSIIINPRMDNLGKGNYTGGTGTDTCICSLDFQDNMTPRVTRYRHLSTTTGVTPTIIELPKFNTHYVDGNVLELETPIQRTVRLYRVDTGEIMDETTSASGTGYFRLETSYSGSHYAICLDDSGLPDYNDLIYGNIIPTVISGTFPYNEGWVS